MHKYQHHSYTAAFIFRQKKAGECYLQPGLLRMGILFPINSPLLQDPRLHEIDFGHGMQRDKICQGDPL